VCLAPAALALGRGGVYSPELMDEAHPDSELPTEAPVFPLPNLVFFPQTILPLHIFEERYREMTARAIATDGYIAMTLLRSEDHPGPDTGQPYHPVGCLGKIASATKTEDGRYYLKLVGLRKVALGEVVNEKPYLRARIRPIAETVPEDRDARCRDDLVRLLGTCGVLFQELSDSAFPLVSIKEGLPYETVVNSICFHLGLPPTMKQSLLEENDLRARCLELTRQVEEYLRDVLMERGEDEGSGENDLVN